MGVVAAADRCDGAVPGCWASHRGVTEACGALRLRADFDGPVADGMPRRWRTPDDINAAGVRRPKAAPAPNRGSKTNLRLISDRINDGILWSGALFTRQNV